MKNSQRILDSIGKLSDGMIESAVSYENPESKRRKIKVSPARPIKRLAVSIIAAVLLSVSLVITVAANSDAIIAAMFERRQKLIDDKIAHIDASVTEGDITLTLKSVVAENNFDDAAFWGRFTISFHNENGVFDKGLKYGGYKIQFIPEGNGTFGSAAPEVDEDGREWYNYGEDRPEDYDPLLPGLDKINFGLDKPSDTIILASLPSYWMYGVNRIIIYDITSADGSVKYADELCVEFTLTTDNVKPLQQISYYEPDLPFEIENAGFVLERIDLSTNRLYIEMTNPGGDTVNIGGVDCRAINYLTKLANSDEYFEKAIRLFERDQEVRKQFDSEYEESEAFDKYMEWRASDEEIQKMIEEEREAAVPTENEKILNECYELVVEVKPESGAEMASAKTYYVGWANGPYPETVKAGFVAEFSSPIYVNDIIRVYAQKIGDPTKQVTVWVPAEDKGLAKFME